MIVVVMGVTGSGKTTVGRLLADIMGWQFADADDFHPARNVEKIRQGIALDDKDRAPWLEALRKAIEDWLAGPFNVVLACSALKSSYRDQLRMSPQVTFVFLRGTYELIRQRLISRHGHFATAQILASQFETLEEPSDAIVVDIDRSPEEIVSAIRKQLGLL